MLHIHNHSSLRRWYRWVVVILLLPSVVIYFCNESRRLASIKSKRLLGSLFIISNKVFLRIGFNLSPRTLNSTKNNMKCTLRILDLFHRTEEGIAVNQLVKNNTQRKHNCLEGRRCSCQNLWSKIQSIIFLVFVDNLDSEFDWQFF